MTTIKVYKHKLHTPTDNVMNMGYAPLTIVRVDLVTGERVCVKDLHVECNLKGLSLNPKSKLHNIKWRD